MNVPVGWRILEARVYNKVSDQKFADWWSSKIMERGTEGSRRLIPEVILALKEVLDEDME